MAPKSVGKKQSAVPEERFGPAVPVCGSVGLCGMSKQLIFWLVLRDFEVLQDIATNTKETSNLGHSILYYPNSVCQGLLVFRKNHCWLAILLSDNLQPGFC